MTNEEDAINVVSARERLREGMKMNTTPRPIRPPTIEDADAMHDPSLVLRIMDDPLYRLADAAAKALGIADNLREQASEHSPLPFLLWASRNVPGVETRRRVWLNLHDGVLNIEADNDLAVSYFRNSHDWSLRPSVTRRPTTEGARLLALITARSAIETANR